MNVIFDARNHDTDGVVFDAPIGGSIVVREDGYVSGVSRSFGVSEVRAFELGGGYFDLRINGDVVGGYYPDSFSPSQGYNGISVDLNPLGSAYVDPDGATSSVITIGQSGHVIGSIAAGHALVMRNHGTFYGVVWGVDSKILFSADSIFNKGSFGAVRLGGGDDLFVNIGSAVFVEMANGNDRVNNSGSISDYVDLGAGDDILNNSGVLDDVVTCGDGDDRVINTGELSGHISWDVYGVLELGNGDDILRNEGIINGAIIAGQGADTVINSGVINGDFYLDEGDNRLFNSGTIAGPVFFGEGNDFILNSGNLGAVFTEGGDDIFRNSGTFEFLNLGAGDDRFYGGEASETLRDEHGDDRYWFGGGDDVYYASRSSLPATTGYDIIYGGSNNALASSGVAGKNGGDLYDFSGSDAVAINLSSAVFNGWRGDAGHVIQGNTAKSSQGEIDRIYEFELATGGQGSDIIIGSADQNHLIGDGGDDQLLGGAGRDLLQGDAGSDEFIYLAFSDSTVTKAGRDIIFEFDANDVIVFSGFGLIADVRAEGEAFTGGAGEVTIDRLAFGWTLKFDMNGDAKADMAIDVTAILTGTTFTSNNFDFL